MNTTTQELIRHFWNIWDENIQRVAIMQMKALASYNPKNTLREALDFAKQDAEIDKDLEKFIEEKQAK